MAPEPVADLGRRMSQKGHKKRAREELDLKIDYGWRWFSYHAKQRVTMVSFFLLGSGVIANAYALLLEKDQLLPSVGVAVLGCITSFVFLGLEWRNRQLVRLGEDVLRTVERKSLFRPKSGSLLGDRSQYGILHREALCGHPRLITHTVLFVVLEVTVGLAFLGAALYAWLGQ